MACMCTSSCGVAASICVCVFKSLTGCLPRSILVMIGNFPPLLSSILSRQNIERVAMSRYSELGVLFAPA